jgi:hypothetical protein
LLVLYLYDKNVLVQDIEAVMEADIEALDRGEAVSDMEPLVIGDGPRRR